MARAGPSKVASRPSPAVRTFGRGQFLTQQRIEVADNSRTPASPTWRHVGRTDIYGKHDSCENPTGLEMHDCEPGY